MGKGRGHGNVALIEANGVGADGEQGDFKGAGGTV